MHLRTWQVKLRQDFEWVISSFCLGKVTSWEISSSQYQPVTNPRNLTSRFTYCVFLAGTACLNPHLSSSSSYKLNLQTSTHTSSSMRWLPGLDRWSPTYRRIASTAHNSTNFQIRASFYTPPPPWQPPCVWSMSARCCCQSQAVWCAPKRVGWRQNGSEQMYLRLSLGVFWHERSHHCWAERLDAEVGIIAEVWVCKLRLNLSPTMPRIPSLASISSTLSRQAALWSGIG